MPDEFDALLAAELDADELDDWPLDPLEFEDTPELVEEFDD